MKTLRLLVASLLTGLFFATAATAQSNFVEIAPDRALIEKLRAGGYVIYMRHGKTDNSRPDQLNVDLNDCNTQRLLSDEGRQVAKDVGNAIRKAKIPVGDIFVSPMCRTKESAQLAFGPKFTVINDLFSSTNQTSEQKKPVIATTRRLLSEKVPAGTNRLILAHAPNLADTMGYFPKVEATVVILVPHGDRFEYVASIKPEMWPDLLR
jgi:phosphohistidine phosphatase SixA